MEQHNELYSAIILGGKLHTLAHDDKKLIAKSVVLQQMNEFKLSGDLELSNITVGQFKRAALLKLLCRQIKQKQATIDDIHSPLLIGALRVADYLCCTKFLKKCCKLAAEKIISEKMSAQELCSVSDDAQNQVIFYIKKSLPDLSYAICKFIKSPHIPIYSGYPDYMVQLATDYKSKIAFSVDNRVYTIDNIAESTRGSRYVDQLELGPLALAVDNNIIISVRCDKYLKIIDTHQKVDSKKSSDNQCCTYAYALVPTNKDIESLHITDNGMLLALAIDKSVQLLGENGLRVLQICDSEGIFAAKISKNGKKFVTGSGKGMLKIWDAESADLLHALKKHSSQIISVDINHNATRMLASSTDGLVSLWDCMTGECLYTWDQYPNAEVVALNPAGTRSLIGLANSVIDVWDIDNINYLHRLYCDAGSLRSLYMTSENYIIASCVDTDSIGISKSTIALWDCTDREAVIEFLVKQISLEQMTSLLRWYKRAMRKHYHFSDNEKNMLPPLLLKALSNRNDDARVPEMCSALCSLF